MSGFATINNVNKALGDGWVTKDGVWRKLGTGYVTKGGIWKKVTSSGMPLSDLPVGALVSMNVNGVATDFIIVHQGLPSSLYDESCNGTWLLMKDVYENRQWHSSNVNDYENSTINAYLNSTFLGLFDSNIQSVIKQVKIPYVNGTGSSAVASGSSGLSAQIFLLSGYEVGWTQSTNPSMNQYFPIDGACLSYFSGTSTTDSKRIAYLDGTATKWWLRSPYTNNTHSTWFVSTDGNRSANDVPLSYGIRPALILPSDALVNPTPNADGSYTLLV